MFFKKKKEKRHEGKVGGLAYFCSLIVLCILGPINIFLNLYILELKAVYPWIVFTVCIALGVFIAHLFIQGHWSVFFHELKHSVLSGLAGNKARDWDIKEQSGHFEYSYTKDTAAYNAFISLAPYWIPLFSLPTIIASWIFLKDTHLALAAILGITYGMDCIMNIRDISPAQSDFTETRGGYPLALTYVIAMNITIFSYYASFISQGIQGPKMITFRLGEFFYNLILQYRGIPTDNLPLP